VECGISKDRGREKDERRTSNIEWEKMNKQKKAEAMNNQRLKRN
jgi:hypothetical protein